LIGAVLDVQHDPGVGVGHWNSLTVAFKLNDLEGIEHSEGVMRIGGDCTDGDRRNTSKYECFV